MSLNVALSSAVSSLLVLEKQMGVTSNNIANANTVGYSKESVQLGESVSAGVGTGVKDLGTTSSVDQFLLASVIQVTGQSSQATAYNTLYQSLQTALGAITTNTNGGNDLTSQLSSLESDLTTLATSASSAPSLSTNVVNDLYNLAANLNSMSTQIQNLRTTADQDITNTVNDANTQLNTINDLNKKIAVASAQGQPTASFEDLRNNALTALTGDLGVQSFINSNNQMQIYTTSGQPLLVGDGVIPLSHQAVTVSGTSSYASGTINGIFVGSTDITTDVTSGKIAAYVQMRDGELPAAQSELDTLAQNLGSTVNNIYGLATPAATTPSSLNGTVTFGTVPAAVSVASGTTVRVALLNNSGGTNTGSVNSYVDVDLTGATDENAVANKINAALSNHNPPLAITASVNAGTGALTLTAGAGYGVNVATMSGAIGATPTTQTDFSSFFGLGAPTQQLLTGGTSTTPITAANIQVRSDILAQPNKLSIGNGTMASMLSTALQQTQSFGASGNLAATTTTLAGFASTIIADIATRASNASAAQATQSTTLSTLQNNLSSQSGVNTDEETAKLTELQSAYAASAKIVSTVQAMFQSLLQAVNG